MRFLFIFMSTTLLIGCVSAQPANTANICQIFEDRRSWYRAADRTEKRWGVPPHVTMAIMYQESSYQARARPARTKLLGFIPWRRPSTARGYAQALDGTWIEYRQQTGNRRAMRSNFSDAADFIGWYTNTTHRRNGVALDDTRNLYLAYHEGNGGFARGSYNGKPWLIDVASRVQANAQRYEAQYAGCREDLGRNWFMRTFF